MRTITIKIDDPMHRGRITGIIDATGEVWGVEFPQGADSAIRRTASKVFCDYLMPKLSA